MLRSIIETLLMYSDDDTKVIIGAVDIATAKSLGVESAGVWIGTEYIKKLQRRHNLTPDQIEAIVEKLNHGTIVQEAANRFSLLVSDVDEKWWIAGLKPERKKNRILISTIHRSNAKQVERKRKKHRLIRK